MSFEISLVYQGDFFKGGTKCRKSTHSTHAWLTLCTQNSTNATHENQHL